MSPPISRALAIAALSVLLALPASGRTESSNIFLPRHVEALDGRVSLYADYEAVQSDGRVPVYLINKTGEELEVNVQDGDVYLKLEYLVSPGQWARAQPHGYSWCGNSYTQRTLQSGHHWIVSGYQPINGERRMIRYRQYGQEVEVWSNAGDGVVDHIDIQRASSDAMSIRNRSFEFVVRIALSDTLFENNAHHIGDPRATAIWELSSKRFDPEKSKELLLKVRERHPEYERHVERALLRIDLRL